MMVFFMHLYVLIVSVAIILIEPVFLEELDRSFWQLFVDGLLRGIRYVLLLFTAGVAVLQYLSAGLGEEPSGFLTTLFYPTVIMILSIGLVAQWLLVPAWAVLIDGFRKGAPSRPTRSPLRPPLKSR